MVCVRVLLRVFQSSLSRGFEGLVQHRLRHEDVRRVLCGVSCHLRAVKQGVLRRWSDGLQELLDLERCSKVARKHLARMVNSTALRCLQALHEHCVEERHGRSRCRKAAAVLLRRSLAKGYRTWHSVSFLHAQQRRLVVKVCGRLSQQKLACSMAGWRGAVSCCVWLRGVFMRVARCEHGVQQWVVEQWSRVCARETKTERIRQTERS